MCREIEEWNGFGYEVNRTDKNEYILVEQDCYKIVIKKKESKHA